MDPYVYPGTGVLKNLRGIRDPERLSRFEMDMTTRRLGELARTPAPARFDVRLLQDIHRYIFQDVNSWAGDFRTVNIGKSGDLFALKEHIAANLGGIFEELRTEHNVAGASLERFSNRAAYYLGEINAIHPFRDGNGRAQREFMRQLALHNGYALDWARVPGDRMIEASRHSFRGNNVGLEQLLECALDNEDNRRRKREREAGDRDR